MYTNKVRSWNITRSGDFYGISWHGGIFAMINKKTCHQLREVADGRRVQFVASVTDSVWTAALNSWIKMRGQATLAVEVNLYGVYTDATEVGSILSRNGAFLQRPLSELMDAMYVRYHNPHYMPLRHSSQDDLACKPAKEAKGQTAGTLPEQSSEVTQINFILNSLAHHNVLQERLDDTRLKTSLLP